MANEPYDVGYAKPPAHTQFKAGQSGNVKGRPKGRPNLLTDLTDELSQTIVVTEGGQQHRVTKQRALVKAMLAKSIKGDVRAASAMLRLIPEAEAKLEAARQLSDQINVKDAISVATQIMDKFFEERQAELKSTNQDEDAEE